MSRFLLQMYLLLIALYPGMAPAQVRQLTQEVSANDFPVCTGWIPSKNQFGLVGIESQDTADDFCPNDHAYFSVLYPGGMGRPGSRVPIIGTCCELPTGALLDETVFAAENCPEGFLATGARQLIDTTQPELEPGSEDKERVSKELIWANRRTQELRCTKLNTERFELKEITSGLNVGWRKSFRTYFDSFVRRASIPISLRIGLGRYSKYSWMGDICVGYPWGSVLIGKTSKYCDGMRFRKIVVRTGRFPATTPDDQDLLATRRLDYERCLVVENMYESNARCLTVHSESARAQERR